MRKCLEMLKRKYKLNIEKLEKRLNMFTKFLNYCNVVFLFYEIFKKTQDSSGKIILY